LSSGSTRASSSTKVLDDHDVVQSVGSVGAASINAQPESLVDTIKSEVMADASGRPRSDLELAIVEYLG